MSLRMPLGEPFTLYHFIRESNCIEGLVYEITTPEQMVAIEFFLSRPTLYVDDMVTLAIAVAGQKAKLREQAGMNVQVGDHFPPSGGPSIRTLLGRLLMETRERDADAYEFHRLYENLHPFMDGNGRTGRLLWLWMLGGIEKAPLGFLHTWYYQSLQHGR